MKEREVAGLNFASQELFPRTPITAVRESPACNERHDIADSRRENPTTPALQSSTNEFISERLLLFFRNLAKTDNKTSTSSIGHFCEMPELDPNNHFRKILRNFDSMRKEGTGCDLVIKVEGIVVGKPH